jgi:hypothetical protein
MYETENASMAVVMISVLDSLCRDYSSVPIGLLSQLIQTGNKNRNLACKFEKCNNIEERNIYSTHVNAAT